MNRRIHILASRVSDQVKLVASKVAAVYIVLLAVADLVKLDFIKQLFAIQLCQLWGKVLVSQAKRSRRIRKKGSAQKWCETVLSSTNLAFAVANSSQLNKIAKADGT